VLFRAIPRRDIKPLAKELIAKFGSFAEVVAAPSARLAEIKGMGEAAITKLKVVRVPTEGKARKATRTGGRVKRGLGEALAGSGGTFHPMPAGRRN
jgi:DNA repair protein RadC